MKKLSTIVTDFLRWAGCDEGGGKMGVCGIYFNCGNYITRYCTEEYKTIRMKKSWYKQFITQKNETNLT